MTRARHALYAALLVCLSGVPAQAASECEAMFAAMGRAFVPDAPAVPLGGDAGGSVLDCPADQLMQFVFDVAAANRAEPVASVDQLLGTWVSDDMLGVVTGLFIPVYEMIKIAPGSAEGEVAITQKLIRAVDPAEFFAGDYNLIRPVDVVAAGRIAIYGEHVAALTGVGALEPRRLRYRDFPIESDRLTGLVMRTRFLSLQQMQPIGIATDGERLVISIMDRMARGDRVMTFRRRQPETPLRALQMAVVGEMSLSLFHCFMQAIEVPGPAFTAALGPHSADEMFAVLDRAYRIGDQFEAHLRRGRGDLSETDRAALHEQLKRLADQRRELFESAPMAAFREATGSDTPFGCRKPY